MVLDSNQSDTYDRKMMISMTLTQTVFNQESITFFDQGQVAQTANNFTPFAYTDLLTHLVTEKPQSFIHFWEFEKTVILGMKDTRVPDLSTALKTLKTANFNYLARNSGGLAVVSDRGILNFSIVFPNLPETPIAINEAYELMAEVIQRAFGDFPVTITAKEISNSYCPGDYDLSIKGQKFAGTAQRRIRQGIAVMVYLSVNGDQHGRGELIRDFYHAGLKEDFGMNGYPPVEPEAMANLSDLLGVDLSVADVKERILNVFQQDFSANLRQTDFPSYLETENLLPEFEQHLAKMTRRNSDIMEVEVL